MEELVLIEDENKKATRGDGVIAFLVILWVLMGILGFFTSIFCFAYNGSFMQNWIGLLTAVTLGPFYWIYFAFAGDQYCSPTQIKNTPVGGRGRRRSPKRR